MKGQTRAPGIVARILCLVLVVACGGTDVGPERNPIPVVESTAPSVLTPDPGGVSVDVFGLGFVDGAEVLWNGEARPTRDLTATRVTVDLSASDLTATSGEISVRNPEPGGGVSPPITVLVANPVPTITGLSPTGAVAVFTKSVTLQVSGSNFVTTTPGARAMLDNVPVETTIVSSSELSASIPDYLLRTGRTISVTVVNPAPAGGVSNALDFDVQNGVPVLSGTDPDGITAGRNSPLTVLGDGFVRGATVWLEGTPLTPIDFSATRLSVTVPIGLAVVGTPATLNVENPGPGGGTSTPLLVTVWNVPPRVDVLVPSQVLSGAAGFTLSIVGADFDPAATVEVDGVSRVATVVSSTRIEVGISSADVSTPRTIPVTVSNPASGSVASAELTVLDGASALLAYVDPSALRLVIVDANGTGISSMPLSPGSGIRADASPIGPTVLIHSSRIYEMDAFTGASRRVTGSDMDRAGDEQWARYGAAGNWIYLMARTSGWEIWRTPTAGGPSELLVPGGDRGYPAPSHAGDRVVYTIGVDPSNSLARLWILDLATGISTPLDVRGHTARWTPDDAWIVYWVPGEHELRVIRPDGTGDFALTTNLDVGPAFDISPDGQWIAANSDNNVGGFLIRFPTGEVQPLATSTPMESITWFGP